MGTLTLDRTVRSSVPHMVTECQYVLFAAALFVGCIMLDAQSGPVGAFPARPVLETQDAFAEATRLYQSGRWAGAYGRFIELADRGDARAAHMALAMHREGPERYGAHWDATPQQLEAWELASRDAPEALLLVLATR